MIAVIADDFTGAAEIAGISLRYGLTVELYLGEVITTNSDVLVICTDSRSLNVEDAKRVTAAAIENISGLHPTLIYKKIDSVLRGHVAEEVNVQMKLCGFKKALVIPANPSLGRIINNGEYFIDGKRITETGFAGDPEFPVKSSRVKEMIRGEDVFVLKNTDDLPGKGIIIGEAASTGDISLWVDRTGEDWMPVGAGDFYLAILEKDHKVTPQAPVELQSPHLYVCGTAFNERKKYIKTLNKDQDCVAYLPGAIDEEWIQKTRTMIREQNKVVLAIGQSRGDAVGLRTSMAKAAKMIIEKESINEVFIEGGSTAAALLKELGINKLSPVNELQRGVVRMKSNNLFITVKPGSYELPAEMKDLYM
jgi:uncharacterized protein YgbK (DUF1537 family)